jgi:glycerol-3-phosphate acyltransferase PlsX
MAMPIRVAIDAMGGDNAPFEIVKGVQIALKDDLELAVTLVGDEAQIKSLLPVNFDDKKITIVHTDQVIAMDASPKKALLENKNASIMVAAKLVNDGKADALVSAGNTGGVVLASAQNLAVLPGIERTGLAAIYPVAKFYRNSGGMALMLDVGATLHCNAKQLVHFAMMGSQYVSKVLGISEPHVGLLNIGEEETKGGEVLTQTYQYLKEIESVNFIGNIEGKDIPKGIADVVVTDGFVGNVVLKMLEGVSEVAKDMGKYAFKKKLTWKIGLAFLASGVKKIKQKTDYSEYGGAPILGFKQLVIKAHGRSNAKAISNAIKIAKKSAKENICQEMSKVIAHFNNSHQIDFILE